MQPLVHAMGRERYISSKDVQGRLPLQWQPVAASTVFSTPDDGRRKRPKHVE